MRSQSFLSTGNDIDLWRGTCRGKTCPQVLPHPLQKRRAASWVQDSSRREGSETEGHLASPEGSGTDEHVGRSGHPHLG